ncbi:MAG: phosphate/phosphite/phosphonate ABC transporter substrate-binding protein [Woeseiaceae bacterium]|nr:phosphate/phosphite/phosphonate ABC transporter substrate-binding protein [Woeseiaceae bacterium]
MKQSTIVCVRVALICATVLLLASPVRAADRDLVLAIQPILDEQQTRKAFQPLCDFLASATGRNCTLFTSSHFYPYWEAARQGKQFNLVLDAAHFTDYRVQKHGFEVLAKVPDSVSYSLITRNDDLIIDPAELVGKRVATLGIPSIGAARLNSLFPKPTRQPMTVEVPDADRGIQMLLEKKVDAAILPTPVVSQHMARGASVNVVMTTDPIPHIALSASATLDPATREVIRQAMTKAHLNDRGREMLKAVGFERFETASASIYKGQATVLQQYWGY